MIGLILFAFGIVIAINANIGYAPWEVFHVGLANTVGLSIGVITIIVGLVLGVIVTIMGEKLGFGTILNMVLIGVFIDVIFLTEIIPIADNTIIGILMLIIGMFLISIGSYFYIKSAFGAGPRDNLMVVLVRKTKLPAGVCRVIIEIVVTVAGWFLGGMVGLGTVIFAIGIGFCIQLTFRVFRFDVTAVKHETLTDTYKALRKK